MKIPFFDLSLNEEDAIKAIEIFKSHISTGELILGNSVKEAEACFSNKFSRTAHLVSSGTSACYLGIKLLNLPKGSKVLTSPITWVATSNAIVENGLIPEFLPIDPKTLNINPQILSSYIDTSVSAVFLVHHGGIPFDHLTVSKICKEHNIYFLEDCAQAFGSKRDGYLIGELSDIATFSFNPMKQLGCLMDLGLIIHSSSLTKQLLTLRHNGTPDKIHFPTTSLNFKPDSIACSLIAEKLRSWEKIFAHLDQLRKIYQSNLKKLKFIQILDDQGSEKVSPYTFPIQSDSAESLHKYLSKNGIETKLCLTYVPSLEAFKSYKDNNLPEIESLCKKVIYLPLYYRMTRIQVQEICTAINKFQPVEIANARHSI